MSSQNNIASTANSARNVRSIRSMTGYAQCVRETPRGHLTLEIKSVNGRFLDVSFRMNDELRQTEALLREAIGQHAVRGKVDCRLSFANSASGAQAASLNINTSMVEALVKLNDQVKALAPQAQDLRVSELLHWPGVLEESSLSTEELTTHVHALATTTVAEFIATREREGAKLVGMLGERVSGIEALVQRVVPLVPQVVAAHNEKLIAKLRETITQAGGILDDDRIRQEVALYAIKIDVAEELSRLSAHVSEVRAVLAGKHQSGNANGVGKRLDFIMQELNREANTLGSKSVSAEVGEAAIEIKILIEQMREQVQNIE